MDHTVILFLFISFQNKMIEEVTFPHPSIVRRETSISLSKCVSSTCGCRWIHCPLCAPGRIGVGTRSFIQKHFDKIHEQPSVKYNGMMPNLGKLLLWHIQSYVNTDLA